MSQDSPEAIPTLIPPRVSIYKHYRSDEPGIEAWSVAKQNVELNSDISSHNPWRAAAPCERRGRLLFVVVELAGELDWLVASEEWCRLCPNMKGWLEGAGEPVSGEGLTWSSSSEAWRESSTSLSTGKAEGSDVSPGWNARLRTFGFRRHNSSNIVIMNPPFVSKWCSSRMFLPINEQKV